MLKKMSDSANNGQMHFLSNVLSKTSTVAFCCFHKKTDIILVSFFVSIF